MKRFTRLTMRVVRMVIAVMVLASVTSISYAQAYTSLAEVMSTEFKAVASKDPAISPQQAGLIVIHSPPGSVVSTESAGFVDMPHMKGAVTLPGTSAMAITVCAESWVTNGQRMFVRALIDGSSASPDDVVFDASAIQDTNCFTFVGNDLAAGVHAVQVQWLVDAGSTAFAGDRTLHITYAEANTNEMRLLAIAAPSGPDALVSGGWVDIPDMGGSIELPAVSDLTISFSAEANTSNNARFFLRALVDGVASSPDDEVLVIGNFTGTRTFSFTRKDVSAGIHDVRLQALVDPGGEGFIGDRTLKVVGAKVSDTAVVGRLMVAAPSGPWKKAFSTEWKSMPGLSGNLTMPTAGDVVISFSAEIWATAGNRVFIRALVDGQPTQPDDVLLTQGQWSGTSAFTFVERNLSLGDHAVEIQWRVDPGIGAYLGDRTMTAYTFARQQPVLFVAMESDRDPNDPRYGGYFSDSVVEMMDGTRVFRGYVRERLFGRSFPSITDYFLENSVGRFFMVEAGLLGPYKKTCGDDGPCPFTEAITEAWTRADETIDFSLYDSDGDGFITRRELTIPVVFYQDGCCAGFVRDIPAVPTNDGVTLDGIFQPHMYMSDFQAASEIGTIVHELTHVFFDAEDLYENAVTLPATGGWDPTAPGPYSLLDQHWSHPHIDPYQKLRKAGWFAAIEVKRDGYYNIGAVESKPQIYRLGSGPDEYFLVENRQQIGYDQFLPDSGLAIWHIDETRGTLRSVIEMEPAVAATTPNQYQNYLFDGAGTQWGRDFSDLSAPFNSRYHDGTLSGVGVWGIPASGPVMRVYLDVPGPGIFVDVSPEGIIVGSESTIQVRLVNTGPLSGTFNLYTSSSTSLSKDSSPGMLQVSVTLASYEERIVTLTTKEPLTITVQSAFDLSVATTVQITPLGPNGLPVK